MTKEEAIEILENGDFWDLCVVPYVYSNRPAMEFHEALDMAIAALRAQQKLLEMLELDRDAWKLCDGCRPNRFFATDFVAAADAPSPREPGQSWNGGLEEAMERLTKRFDGWVMREGCHGPCRTCNGVKCADIFPMIDRLAAYEDTGLEPEEVTQIKLAIMEKSLAEIKEFEGVSIDRMIELTQAEKDGRLVVLPDAKYTDADGEKALQTAMWTCGNTNNPVTRYTADAIAEKLCREARDKNPPLTLEELREMDGRPVWVCEPNGTNGVWGLVDLEYQMVRLHGGGLAVWENNDKSWLAYRRKPEEG